MFFACSADNLLGKHFLATSLRKELPLKLQALWARAQNTHLFTSAIALVSVASSLGLIHLDPSKVQAVITLLGAGAVSTVAAAVNSQPTVPPAAPPQP